MVVFFAMSCLALRISASWSADMCVRSCARSSLASGRPCFITSHDLIGLRRHRGDILRAHALQVGPDLGRVHGAEVVQEHRPIGLLCHRQPGRELPPAVAAAVALLWWGHPGGLCRLPYPPPMG